jgi:hypothetical protein
MKTTADVSRKRKLFPELALVAALLVAAGQPAEAADQATKNRCTAYAQHAVQQYQLMKSHPQCVTNSDPLTWQDNYDNHYNGCLLLPASMAKMAEQGRDNHLQACGALSDATPPPASSAPSAASTTPVTSTTSGAPGGGAAAVAQESAATVAAGAGGPSTSLVTPAPGFGEIGCRVPPGGVVTMSGAGLVTDLKGSALTYHGSPPITSQTSNPMSIANKAAHGEYPLTTAIVARPQFYSGCRGIPAVSALGPWIAAGGPGQPPLYIWVNVGGVLSWEQITPAVATALLTGKTPTPAAAATSPAPTPAKTAAPIKAAH